MRHSLLPLLPILPLLLSSPELSAQSADGGARRQITRVDPRIRDELYAARDAIWRAWFANDRAVLMRMLPENFVGIGWGGGVWDDRQRALDGAAEHQRQGGRLVRLEFPYSEIQLFGDVALVYSEYLVEGESGGQRYTQRGRVTEVFVRRDGGWINPAWHLDSGR